VKPDRVADPEDVDPFGLDAVELGCIKARTPSSDFGFCPEPATIALTDMSVAIDVHRFCVDRLTT
jgi:hypothetical protein